MTVREFVQRAEFLTRNLSSLLGQVNEVAMENAALERTVSFHLQIGQTLAELKDLAKEGGFSTIRSMLEHLHVTMKVTINIP